MPGVIVSTATQGAPVVPLRAASGQFFVTGITERGDTVKPVTLRGMADYHRLLGNRVTYGTVYDTAKLFFDEGGEQMIVARVVGTTPTVGTANLVDRAGTPLSTLRVDAANPGSWSNTLTVEVANGSLTNTFQVIVRLAGEIVESKTNLASPSAAAQAFAQSPYIRLTDLASATAAPNNNPAVVAPVTLSTGNDDRATITGTSYTNALARFTRDLGSGAVAIPGQNTSVHTALVTHAEQNNRVALLAAARNSTESALKTLAASFDTEFAGLFAGHLLVSDGAGGTRNVSPEGYVAAVRSRAHSEVGPWRVPAGEIGRARTIVGVDQDWDRTVTDSLYAARVNPIKSVGGSIRLYGWRSLSADEANYAMLKDRDFLNYLVVEGESRLEQFVFAPIDAYGQLLSAVHAEIVGLIDPFRERGGIYPLVDPLTGDDIDPGYKVETGTNVNTSASLASNEIRARLSVRISPTGALVTLEIVKVATQAGL